MAEPGRLTAKQIKAMEALVVGASIQDAALAAGVNRKTIGRWLQDATFWKLYQVNSRRVLELAARRLTGKLDAAVGLLSSVIDDDEAPAAVRLRAASQVIDGSLKLLEITDIQERLMALEERLEHA